MTTVGPGLSTFVQPAVNYGSDLDCVTDLSPTMTETSGLHMLAEALVRRLITPRGTLIDDGNYGYDIRANLNDDVTATDISRIQSQVDAELLKDERVRASQTSVTFIQASGLLTLSTIITPSAGPTFNLTLAVTQVTAALLAPVQ